jgi:hypothetical protein
MHVRHNQVHVIFGHHCESIRIVPRRCGWQIRLTAWATPSASYFKFQIANTKSQTEQSRPDGHAVKRAIRISRPESIGIYQDPSTAE